MEALKKLGFTTTEIEIYKLLLKSGPLTVLQLSKECNIARATVHHNVEKLKLKELVADTFEGSTRKLIAEDPSKIYSVVKKEEENLKIFSDRILSLKTELPFEIDMLEQIKQERSTEIPGIKFYEGKESVKNIHSEAILSKEIRAYVDGSQIVSTHPGNNFQKFNNAAKKGVRIFDIHVDAPEIRKFTKSNQCAKNYKIKLLPKDRKILSMDFLLFDNTVAIVQGNSHPYVIKIESEILYQNLREMHDLLWSFLPELE